MNLLNFSIHTFNNDYKGVAEIIDTNMYNDLLKEVGNKFDGFFNIGKIGQIKKEVSHNEGFINTYDVYKTYEDSKSTNYYYYALLTSSEPVQL